MEGGDPPPTYTAVRVAVLDLAAQGATASPNTTIAILIVGIIISSLFPPPTHIGSWKVCPPPTITPNAVR